LPRGGKDSAFGYWEVENGLFFQHRGLGIDQMNPRILPDVLELPVKNENAELIFLPQTHADLKVGN